MIAEHHAGSAALLPHFALHCKFAGAALPKKRVPNMTKQGIGDPPCP